MKAYTIFISIAFFLFVTSVIFAQNSDFNISEYQEFLTRHQDLSSTQLLEMHPAGLFEKKANTSWESALYHDSVEIKYNLTKDEIFLLKNNGFLVTERLNAPAFGTHLLDIWWKDLPVFISTDVILYAFHFAYDRILVEIERGVLINRVSELLKNLHHTLPDLEAIYKDRLEMVRMLRDVDIYLTIPLKLLGEEISPNYQENLSEINEILALISNESVGLYPFFSETCKEIDFSQFRPRGHYADDEQLKNYFRAMMWLGRIEVYLLAPQNADPVFPCPPQSFTDIQRQTIDAVLITELMELANATSLYQEIEEIVSFLVGEQDNVTPVQLISVLNEIDYTTSEALLDSTALVAFQEKLKEKSFAFQRIQSQILYHNPFSPKSVQPASAFMLFGQRYIIDSYVTSQVVFDKIKYENRFICRLFPSTLDVLFTLGNDAAGQLLVDELNAFHYATNLSALRYLVDSYDDEFWISSIYNMWLYAIRALNPPQARNHLPSFMQTAGWWQEKMNTQLSSWTELRHDNLLYAKPSYTSGIGCSYPYGYVEPIPEFYHRLNTLAKVARKKFENLSFADDKLKKSVKDYYLILEGVTDTLGTIAQKELDGIPFNPEEHLFIQQTIYQDGWYGGGDITGWYAKLLYGKRFDILRFDIAPENSEGVVVDFHTTPTDCEGTKMGWVSHAGTGPVDLAIITAQTADGQWIAYTGPVSSYYEYRTTNFQRLTDTEWNETYQKSSSRPEWVNLYLADTEGQFRGDGLSLVTSLSPRNDKDTNLPLTYLMIRNYPNPFNPETIINFVIPSHLTNSFTELIIYNIQGKVIKHLIKEDLPSGNYLTKWKGRNDTGEQVSSGIYFYQLKVGEPR